jgi:hypothetical protein
VLPKLLRIDGIIHELADHDVGILSDGGALGLELGADAVGRASTRWRWRVIQHLPDDLTPQPRVAAALNLD